MTTVTIADAYAEMDTEKCPARPFAECDWRDDGYADRDGMVIAMTCTHCGRVEAY